MVKTKQGNKETTAAAKPLDRRLFRIMAFGDSNTFGTAAVAVPPSFRLATEDHACALSSGAFVCDLTANKEWHDGRRRSQPVVA